MTKEERFDLIGKFLRGELKDEAKADFVHRLKNETGFQEDLALHKEVHYAIGDQKLQAFKETLAASEEAYFTGQSKSSSFFLLKYWKNIAVGVFLLIASAFIYKWASTPSEEELFAQYFEIYQAPTTFRNVDVFSLDKRFVEGLAKYDNGQYQAAIESFSAAASDNQDHAVISFLIGVSRLAINDLGPAQVELEKVIADENSLFIEQSKWYLALVHLRRGEREQAVEILRQLPEDERANELLRKLM